MESPAPSTSRRRAWSWIPTLYFAEGLPYVVVMIVSVIMYKRLGVSNTEIALYTSWLYLPWVIKPLWSPIVDILKTKRLWIIVMQLLIGAGLAGVAFTISMDNYLQWTLAFLWLLAFSSATHDIAADGFYMLGLSENDQAWFVGIRSTFYRLAMITGQGLLIILAGFIESGTGLPTVAFDVQAQTGGQAQVAAPLLPDSIVVTEQAGPLHIVQHPENVQIAVAPRSQEEVDALLAQAKVWNGGRGFYPVAAPMMKDSDSMMQETTVPEDMSWWESYISGPLGNTLANWFGPEMEESGMMGNAGNVGVVYFTLSGPVPAGENVVVNLGREDGDPSIRLIEGDRFTFTEANWDEPMMAIIQLDPKLDGATTAQFVARSGDIPFAWSITFFVLAGMFVLFFIYHRFALPRPAADVEKVQQSVGEVLREFGQTFASFFRKKHIGIILAFLMLYRFAEAQIAKMASPFLLDAKEVGGLALTTGEVGFVYGTVGILLLTVGGILGGFLASRDGLKKWLWWMVIAINIPNAVYIFLAYGQPESYLLVNIAVALEQFGYGFGFTAYMLYMIYVAEGEHKTAHFAICTGFMALGMMIPGMFSGWLQEVIGYQHFFVWVLIATIPGFLVTYFIPLDPTFGKKVEEPEPVAA